jgi:hypothetical protein
MNPNAEPFYPKIENKYVKPKPKLPTLGTIIMKPLHEIPILKSEEEVQNERYMIMLSSIL